MHTSYKWPLFTWLFYVLEICQATLRVASTWPRGRRQEQVHCQDHCSFTPHSAHVCSARRRAQGSGGWQAMLFLHAVAWQQQVLRNTGNKTNHRRFKEGLVALRFFQFQRERENRESEGYIQWLKSKVLYS